MTKIPDARPPRYFPFLVLFAGLLLSSPVLGEDNCADPCSIVPSIIYCPIADLTYQVTAKNYLGPIAGAYVEVRILSTFNAILCWTAHGDTLTYGTKKSGVISYIAIADNFGVAKYQIGAGGCIPYLTSAAARKVEVYANSVKIGDLKGGRSPDVVDQNGKLPIDNGYAPTQCEVGLSDSSYLTPAFKGSVTTGRVATCGDLNSSGAATLSDAVLFTPHATGAHSSPRL